MKSKLTLTLVTATLGLTCAVLMFSVPSASAGEVKNKATAGCLDSDKAGNVYTKGCNGGGFQNWNFRQSGSNWVFKNDATAGCLDSDTQGKVYTKDCKGDNPYQRWEFSSDKGGVYKNEATGLCLDSGNNGEVVYTYGCADRYAGQKWDS